MDSGLVERSSLFRSLDGSLGLVAFRGQNFAEDLSASLGMDSASAEQGSTFRPLPITTFLLLIVAGMAGGFLIMFTWWMRGWWPFHRVYPDEEGGPAAPVQIDSPSEPPPSSPEESSLETPPEGTQSEEVPWYSPDYSPDYPLDYPPDYPQEYPSDYSSENPDDSPSPDTNSDE